MDSVQKQVKVIKLLDIFDVIFLLIFLKNHLFLFPVHWYFICIYVYVRVLDDLELDL